MQKLPRLRLSASIGRLDWRDTRVILLDGLLRYRHFHLFHVGIIKNGLTEITLLAADSTEQYVIYVDHERDQMTFFSRWRCTGYTLEGLRFVLWNPKKIERDAHRRSRR